MTARPALTCAISAPCWFDGETIQGPAVIALAGNRIGAIHPAGWTEPNLPIVSLPADTILAPGFIDVQVNGGGGALLNDAPTPETIARIAAAHRRFGTTGLLPTLITDARNRMGEMADCAADAMALPGVLGLHLEGPFLNAARKGIHPADHIRAPDAADVALLSRIARAGRSMITLAPEQIPRDQLQQIAATGLRISIGHSNATGRDVADAIGLGARGVTHLFNAMSQMTPREPGVVGAALASDDLFAGIICDGLHVDRSCLKTAFRAKGRDQLMLVTDAMPLVGSSANEFMLQGRRITLNDGRLTDGAGTLAGAHLTMIDAVWNAVEMMGARLEDALVMASRTPARFLGLEDSHGQIRVGATADLVAFSGRSVLATWIGGRQD